MTNRPREHWYLRDYRIWRGMSQEELADASGVARSRISELENGSERYNQDVLEALAAALSRPKSKVTPADLLARPPQGPMPMADLWDHIPDAHKPQARRVLESFIPDFKSDISPSKVPAPKRKKN